MESCLLFVLYKLLSTISERQILAKDWLSFRFLLTLHNNKLSIIIMNEDTKAKFELAISLCEHSQFDEARPILDEVLKESPDNSEAWWLAAQVDWMHSGDVDKAYDELIESLKLDPKNKWALLLMGNLLSRGKKDMNSAKEYYNKVLEYTPDDIVAINNVAGIMMENNEFDDAIELFKRALKIDDTFVNSYYGIALSYYKKGDLQNAFEYCHQGALKSVKRPENPGVREALLKLYVHCAEELDKQTNYPRIWHKIKQKLEVLGDAPIVFQQDSNLQVYAKVEYGPTYGRKEHIVKYNPQKEYVSHLFVHEMMHLEMLIADTRTGGQSVRYNRSRQERVP